MLILIHGRDDFRSRRKLNEIIESCRKEKRDLDFQYLEGKDLNYREFKDQFFSKTIFKGKKLLVIKDAFSNKGFREGFLKEAGRFAGKEGLILFYEQGLIPGDDPLIKFLVKKGKVIRFQPLDGQKLRIWAKEELGRRHLQIEPPALEKLVNDIGNDLWRFSNEIEKLSCYKKSGKIKIEDLELLIKPRAGVDIFRTIDSLASGNRAGALQMIRWHLERGDSPPYLLAMITYQFRNLLLVKSYQSGGGRYLPSARKLNLHPYVLKKAWGQAGKFDLEELKKIYRKIFQADLKVKTGKFGPRAALDFLVAET